MKLSNFMSALLIFTITLNGMYALCNENQIDINTASLEKLDELYGIGPAKAQAIIDARTFDSVDELISVNGIGEVTLTNIKAQGLACVSDEKVSEKNSEKTEKSPVSKEETPKQPTPEEKPTETPVQEKTIEVIKLDAKNIKSQSDSQNSTEKYARYGLAFFCILLLVLFALKYKTIFRKNEFR